MCYLYHAERECLALPYFKIMRYKQGTCMLRFELKDTPFINILYKFMTPHLNRNV